MQDLVLLAQKLLNSLDAYDDDDFDSLSILLKQIGEQTANLDDDTQTLAYQLSQTFKQQSDYYGEFEEELQDSDEKDSDEEYKERLRLIKMLLALPQPQFEQIVFSLNTPSEILPGSSAPQGERAFSLLVWSEGPTGCGIEELQNVLNEIIKRR